MSKQLCVLGSINADHIISVPRFAKAGETLTGYGYQIAYGGKGANQAVAAARLGAKVDFIGCIGDDEIGRAMKMAFAKDGINTTPIQEITGETTGVAMIQVTEQGENSIVISAGANGRLDDSVVERFQNVISEADYLLTQLETPLQAVDLAIKTAKSHGTKVILNPAPARALPDELLQNIDVITPNETETEILTGIKVIDEQTACQAANVFHQKGIATVLITLGEKGVFVSEQGNGQIVAGFRVQAIDTTAAGDTFNGAFVTALLENKATAEAITFAHAAAALSVTRKGAQTSIPYREEVGQFLVEGD